MKMLPAILCSALLCVAASAVAAPSMALKPSAAVGDSGEQFCQKNYPYALTCIPFFNNAAKTKLDFNLVGLGMESVDPGETMVFTPLKFTRQLTVTVTSEATHKKIYSGIVNDFDGLKCSDTKCRPWT